jgi:hypothetical protein
VAIRKNRLRLGALGVVLAAAAAVALTSGSALAASGGGKASGWHIGYYNPGNSLSFAQATQPAGGLAALNFTNQANTALLVTDQKAQFPGLLGNLTGKTLSASATIGGATGAFTYYGEGGQGDCGTPASVRLFFETSNAGGFDETHYWWSNPVSATLANGTITLSTSTNGANWSDFYGHFGNEAGYSAGFNAAVANVTEIGLSFGGGCFFENGVGTTDGSGTFTLNSYTSN